MKEVRDDPCTFDGCDRTPLYDLRRGLCKGHYMWFHDRGLLGTKPTTADLLTSHWRRITPEGCWEWLTHRHPRNISFIRRNCDDFRILCANHHYELTLTGQIAGTEITQ